MDPLIGGPLIGGPLIGKVSRPPPRRARSALVLRASVSKTFTYHRPETFTHHRVG
jgi:hypothetical protein